MNVKNNKRPQETIDKTENALFSVLKDNELNNVSVTELCKAAGIDRSTFYTNYEDVPALANEVAAKIERQLENRLL